MPQQTRTNRQAAFIRTSSPRPRWTRDRRTIRTQKTAKTGRAIIQIEQSTGRTRTSASCQDRQFAGEDLQPQRGLSEELAVGHDPQGRRPRDRDRGGRTVSTLGWAMCAPEKTRLKMARISRRLTPRKTTRSAWPSAVSAVRGDLHLAAGVLGVGDDQGAVPDRPGPAVGLDVDPVVHALGQAEQDGQAVAERAEALEPLVGQLEDVGDQPDADDVQGVAAAPAIPVAGTRTRPDRPAGGGRRGCSSRACSASVDAEIPEERVARSGRDEPDLAGAAGRPPAKRPLTTSNGVPSPPRQRTRGTPSRAADRPSSTAWPGRSEKRTSRPGISRPSRARGARKHCSPRPWPAAGLTMRSVRIFLPACRLYHRRGKSSIPDRGASGGCHRIAPWGKLKEMRRRGERLER